MLEEDEDTGAQRYKYVRTGEDHFSLAFTYVWMAASDMSGGAGWLRLMDRELEDMRRRGLIP